MTAPMQLRPYQTAAVEAVLARFRAGDRSTLLVLPTGCGKTVVFADIARRGVQWRRRTLVLAHRTELLDQARSKLLAVGVDAAIEQADQRAGDAPVVVASVQTLRGARLASFAPDAFHLIVVDEAHHAAAASYGAILGHFSGAKVLGVTATPDRLDGAALGAVFQSCAYRYELRQAIRDGWLAPIRARRVVVDGVDLGGVHTRAGDFDQGELAEVMADAVALHGVAKPLLDLSGDRKAILFAVNVAHAKALAEVLNAYQPGIARAVDGSASATERAGVLEAFRAGAFRVLVNCALFTEGFDEPSIACVGIARPTKSRALYTQMVGRGTRLAEGKTDCLVLDFTAMAGRHRLVGPADVLAGRELADGMRADVERLLAADAVDVDQALEVAARTYEHTKVQAVARYRSEEIDPFLGDLPPVQPGPWSGDLATEGQRRALERAGLDDLPAELTKGEASRWIDAITKRREAGLATLKQVRLLRRHGVDARRMSFDEANERIGSMLTGWRRGDAA